MPTKVIDMPYTGQKMLLDKYQILSSEPKFNSKGVKVQIEIHN